MTYLLISVFALSLMILLMPLLQRLALHIGAVDLPGARKVHTVPVPRIGGVLIGFSILLSLLVFAPLARELRALMAGAMVICGLGLTDDLMGVKAIYKFGLQWLVAALFLAMSISLYPPGLSPPAWMVLPGAAFFLVALVNAINLQDGLDGLAAGQVAISSVCMGIHLLYSGEWILVLVLTATVSAVMGFLRVNTWPASIFMGDSGSYLLGFLLGGVFLLGVASGSLPWWSGFFYFALPLADMAQVTVGRLFGGRPVFQADRSHVHHRLMDRGFTHQDVVYLEYIAATALGMVPLLIQSPLRLRWLALGLVVLLGGVFLLQQRVGHATDARNDATGGTAIWRVLFLAGCVALFFVELTGFVRTRPSATPALDGVKYGLLPVAVALGYALYSSIRLRQVPHARIDTSLALLVATQLFIFHQFGPRGGGSPDLALLHTGLWLALALLGLLRLVVGFREIQLVGTPLEYLMVFLALALLFLPIELKGMFRTDYLAFEMLSFFLVLRVATHGLSATARRWMLPLAGAGLFVLALAGWLRG